MQNNSSVIACLGVGGFFVYFFFLTRFLALEVSTPSAALKRQIKPVVLSAWSIWNLARLPKNFFFPSYSLSARPLTEFICRIKWKSIPFMQIFLKQQGYVWSQEWRFVQWKPWWWFLPTQGSPRPFPPRSSEREDQTALSKPGQASDLPFLNIVHFSKHHCKFAVCLLGNIMPPPPKFYACMYVCRYYWTPFIN